MQTQIQLENKATVWHSDWGKYVRRGAAGGLLVAGLFVAAQVNYLLFHALAEGFAILVAALIYVFATRTHVHARNDYLLFLGNAYAFVAVLDFLHLLTYQGMGVFPQYTANTPTQLWIAGRYLDALSLLVAPVFLRRRLPRKGAFALYALVVAALVGSVMWLGVFPTSFVPGVGLTAFKVVSEYVICVILVAAMVHIHLNDRQIDPATRRLMMAAMVTTIAAELSFTLYTDVYGVMNFIGHVLKIVAYYLVYLAIVKRGLEAPYAEITELNDGLERRVAERTVALLAANRVLESEVARRASTELELRQSEERFRATFEQAAVGVAHLSLEGRFLRYNQKLCDVLGYERDDLADLAFQEVLHPDDAEEDLVWAHRLTVGEIPSYDLEQRYRRKDGSLAWVHATGSLVRDASGQPAYYAAFVEDISERRRLTDELRRLWSAVEQSPATVVITDTRGSIEYVNPKFVQLTGYTREEVIGHNPSILQSGQTPREVYQNLWHTIRAGNEWHGEFLNKNKNGVLYWEAASISPVRDSDGAITHFVAVKEDITERKREEQFREEYVSLISHDLRAPLTVIIGQAQLLLRATDKPEVARRSGEAILTSGRRMGAMIQDLVDTVRLESGQVSLDRVSADLPSLVMDLRGRMATGGEAERIEVRPGDRNIPPALADVNSLERILTNLLSNALKYSEAEVRVAVEARDNQLVVSVSDRGRGIARDDLPRIFDRFYRVSGSLRPEGLGLGLYITKMLVEANGGHIWVESEVGRGSTFFFTLPVA
ncbi:MAG: MASE3 domain-containing protein [Chloroflexota bacterium]